MDTEQGNNNYLDYRFSESVLQKCNNLLELHLQKSWILETAYSAYLKACVNTITSDKFMAVVEQFVLEEDQQIKRLGKIGEVLGLNFAGLKSGTDDEINQLMVLARSALDNFSEHMITGQWMLILEFEKLVHYKMAEYQIMAGWAKFLRLYGIQELLEDSLDEYVHQDLVLNLLSEMWER